MHYCEASVPHEIRAKQYFSVPNERGESLLRNYFKNNVIVMQNNSWLLGKLLH